MIVALTVLIMVLAGYLILSMLPGLLLFTALIIYVVTRFINKLMRDIFI